MAGAQALPAHSQGKPRAAEVRPARRPALRQRRHPHRPRGQQDPQGHHRQVARRCPASTRPTCRAGIAMACRSSTRSRRQHGKNIPADAGARAVPRLRRRADRAPEKGFHPPRRARRLGQSLPDHGFQDRGRQHPRARQDLEQRLSLSRPQAGALVPRLRLGAGRSRGGIRGPHFAGDRRRVSRSPT